MLNKIRKMLKQQEGFTLVELMIVVVILGIISGIGIQQYGKVQERAREGVDDANIKIIENAARMYQLSEGKAPENIDDLRGYGLEEPPVSPWPESEYWIELDGTSGSVKAYNTYEESNSFKEKTQ